jgi:RsiW-degrading membrane proteinase PrsW (M82 family)
MQYISPETFFLSLIGGVVPAVVWLLFWLREDKKRPEPRGLLMETFVLGMLMVPIAIKFEIWTQIQGDPVTTFMIWGAIEEICKFGAAYFIALRRKEMNEPIDALIYMMTVALGFSALENAIFLVTPISGHFFAQSLITGNMRFIGASLLHTISSATIGIAIGFTYYKDWFTKSFNIFWGLILAIALHTTFNLLIMEGQSGTTFATFGFVWIAIVILMLFFEKIKKIYPVNKI